MEKEYNSWFGFGLPNQPEYREIKVENLYWEYSVRITGNTELAYLRPSVYSGSIGEDDYKDLSIKETRDDYDILIVKIKKSVQSVQNISNLKEEIYKIFLSKISLFEKNLSTVNTEVAKIFIRIKEYISKIVEGRRKNFSVAINVFEEFNIPLNNNGVIKFAQPLTINKRNATLPEKKRLSTPNDYYIKNKDIEEINKLIFHYCSSMERMPSTYINTGEEVIRNTILAALNTQYSNATGETFSNKGKTDIFIGKYDSAAYIAECKLWKGKSVLYETINQLLGYTTYKECKGTILIFNKDNKDFTNLLSKIPDLIKQYPSFVSINKIDKNRIDFAVKKEDESIFDIRLMIFNFYFEKADI